MDTDNHEIPMATRKRAGHPGKIKDETGKRYGRLTVLRIDGRNVSQQVTWLCQCDCGETTVQAGASLRAGTVVSCGCYHAEVFTSKTHGLSRTGPYASHKEMLRRCQNEDHIGWKDYGGRGIKVCDRWLVFENFYEDMAPTWRKGLSLERRDVNGDYCKDNCYWATMTEQNNNKRNNVRYTHAGETLTSAQWARRANISLPLFRSRIKYGWSMERILASPPHHSAGYKGRKSK